MVDQKMNWGVQTSQKIENTLKNYKKILGEKIFFSIFQNFFYLFSDRPFSSKIGFHDFKNMEKKSVKNIYILNYDGVIINITKNVFFLKIVL